VEADSGAMGGKESHEFMVRTPAGEDRIVSCDGCGYAANMEKATSGLEVVEDLLPQGDGTPLEVHTPGQKTIEDVARFLGVSPKNKIKTLAYMSDEPVSDKKNDKNGKNDKNDRNDKNEKTGKTGSRPMSRPIVVLMRGDHQLNEAKFNAAVGVATRPMEEAEIKALFKSPAGYLGPVAIEWAKDSKKDAGLPLLLVDEALKGRTNLIAGANKEDYHLKNLTPGKDFHPTAYADLRAVTAGEACPNCGKPLRIDTAVEIGHIFKLGYRYSDSMGLRVLDKNGKEAMPIMGCYGIGIERILTAAVEQSNDENGFWLPPTIAPFQIVVTPVNVKDESLLKAAVDIGTRLESAGFDVVLDDRDERPGVKFKDADLVGIPFRITVGKKVTEGTVEVVLRSTREVRDVTIATVVEYFQGVLPAKA
jgi:prolyl-tRNA synthetase